MSRIADLRSWNRVRFVPAFLVAAVMLLQGEIVRAQNVPAGAVLREDIVSVEPTVRIDGTLTGDIVVLGGEVEISGLVEGDVFALGSKVTLVRGATIVGDLVTIGGTTVGVRNAKIGGNLVSRPDAFGGGFAPPKGFLSYAIHFSLLAMWLLATVIITLIAGREVRTSSLELRASPLHTFTLGLVALTSLVLTLIVLSYLIPYFVGIPLIITVSALAVVTKIYGTIAVFHAVGSWLFGPKSRADLDKRSWMRGDLALAVAGLLVLGVIRLIPVVGIFLWMVASVFGIGTALATKFGRREPWFLAVRQVSW